jgi:hypothetical protein
VKEKHERKRKNQRRGGGGRKEEIETVQVVLKTVKSTKMYFRADKRVRDRRWQLKRKNNEGVDRISC